MSPLAIFEGAVLFAAGAASCYLLLWWKDRNLKKVKTLEAEALLAKARSEAEMVARDARLAANEESLKLRQQVEASFAARRAERAELERRLSEREGLINSQLERIVEPERTLKDQKESLRKRTETLQERERELAEWMWQEREQLRKLADRKSPRLNSSPVALSR